MNKITGNEPAFQSHFFTDPKGLTIRQYFAAQALGSFGPNVPIVFGFPNEKDLKSHAKKCVAMADALIDELNLTTKIPASDLITAINTKP